MSVLWLVGPGGIGKTSLLEVIAEAAHAQLSEAGGATQGGPTMQDNGKCKGGHHNCHKGNGTGREPPAPD